MKVHTGYSETWWQDRMSKKFGKIGIPACSNCGHPGAIHFEGTCIDIHPKRNGVCGKYCPCEDYQ